MGNKKGYFCASIKMKRNFLIILLFIIVFDIVAEAQRGRKNFSGNRRNRYRYEYVFGFGVTNFLGDLGGLNKIGTDYSPVDLEFTLTRPAAMFGWRYRLGEFYAVRGTFAWGIARGDDKLTKEFFRNNRNLSFKSNLFELSAQFEGFIMKSQGGHRYKIKGAKGFKAKDIQGYGFVGIGAVLFNPKAKYLNGRYYPLQPLGTEGQGLVSGTKKYSRVTVAIPVGIGGKYAIDRYWSIGFETGWRKTFTDYMDDVSTTYHTQTLIANGATPQAIYFADPTQGQGLGPSPSSVAEGEQRGDPKQNDSYLFFNITAAYKVIYKKRTRSKF